MGQSGLLENVLDQLLVAAGDVVEVKLASVVSTPYLVFLNSLLV